MRVDDFALARGATEPVTSKQVAEQVWAPKFLAEIGAGRDPRVPPTAVQPSQGLTVADLLDRYRVQYVEAQGLRSLHTIAGQLKTLKAALGDLPVAVLERPDAILKFKAEYRSGRTIATVNRVLDVSLRAGREGHRGAVLPVIPGVDCAGVVDAVCVAGAVLVCAARLSAGTASTAAATAAA